MAERRALTEAKLIAPCGMNCGICLGHLREKRHCRGCHEIALNDPVTRVRCIIRSCEVIQRNRSGFCYECDRYPCARLKQLDKRYRTKYGMSMLENLEFIRGRGLEAFVERENRRWRCTECGGVICVHRGFCWQCGAPRHT